MVPDPQPDVLHLKLYHHHLTLQVVRLGLVDAADHLLVGQITGSICVHQVEQAKEVSLVDLQKRQRLPEVLILDIRIHELFEGQDSVLIHINGFAHVQESLLCISTLLHLFVQVLALLLLVGLPRTLHDHCEDEIRKTELDCEQGAAEDDDRPWLVLDHRDRTISPAISSHEGLKEHEHDAVDGIKRRQAQVVVAVYSVCRSVQELDRKYGPNCQKQHDHDQPPEHGGQRADDAGDHGMEFGRHVDNPGRSRKPRNAKETQKLHFLKPGRRHKCADDHIYPGHNHNNDVEYHPPVSTHSSSVDEEHDEAFDCVEPNEDVVEDAQPHWHATNHILAACDAGISFKDDDDKVEANYETDQHLPWTRDHQAVESPSVAGEVLQVLGVELLVLQRFFVRLSEALG
mmetsp:Transcript_61201/g.145813  ORF Transcript_61201/g.145813 Transcript_61201/m.145813 type:complete len:401 (-) Transcript_61201:164-1366(-)